MNSAKFVSRSSVTMSQVIILKIPLCKTDFSVYNTYLYLFSPETVDRQI